VLTSVARATERIPDPHHNLPNGFQPEGITISGEQFYVGSIPTGAVYRGSLRTGKGAVFVRRSPAARRSDEGRPRAAVRSPGGPNGNAFVYSAKSGGAHHVVRLRRRIRNDVVVTKRAAWFTDSSKPVLYRLPPRPQRAAGRVVHLGLA
jgi:hypothetical protein